MDKTSSKEYEKLLTEVERMTVDLLKEMDDLSPEAIENFRRECFEKPEQGKVHSEKVDNYINVVCDVAIERANKRVQVA